MIPLQSNHPFYRRYFFVLILGLAVASPSLRAEDQAAAASQIAAAPESGQPRDDAAKEKKEDAYDFENEEAYMDVPDALRSKQFVHRAILSTIIRDTAKVKLGSMYFNYLLGFNAIYQPSNRGGRAFAKYSAGSMAASFGYSTQGGHSVELGIEASSISSLFVGYRYFMASDSFTLWPYIGGGAGTEIAAFRLSDIPIDAKYYQGQTSFGFLAFGAIVPLVDLAIKVEARANFFGLDRLMLNTGLGIIFFI